MKAFILATLLLLLPQSAGLCIEGVVRSETGDPISGVRVMLQANPPMTHSGPPEDQALAGRVTLAGLPFLITDSGGGFVFNELNPGPYWLRVRANGYVGNQASFSLKEGESIKDLSIRLERTGTISGRVRDSSGRPISNMSVQLVQREYESYGQGKMQNVDTAHTNDRGEYRIYGITPGRYHLFVGSGLPPYLRGVDWLASGNRNPGTDSFGYAFYPGTPTIEDATAINVRPGAELGGMDFTMTSQPVHRIRGRLMDVRTGQAPPSPEIKISERNSTIEQPPFSLGEVTARYGLRSTYSTANGILEIRELSPGTYDVTATAVEPRPLNAPANYESARLFGSATIVVRDADVEDVVLSMFPLGSISGRLRVQGATGVSAGLTRVEVGLTPITPGTPEPSGAGYTAEDGTFSLERVAHGEYRASVSGGYPGEVYVKEVRFGGVDVLNSPLRFSGPTSGLLEVLVNMNGGQISGTVSDDRGKPAGSIRVVLIPDRFRERPDLFKTSWTDGDSRFIIGGIAPGNYKVFAWIGIESNAWRDPDFLQQWESSGRPVRIAESARETVDVRVIQTGGTR